MRKRKRARKLRSSCAAYKQSGRKLNVIGRRRERLLNMRGRAVMERGGGMGTATRQL